MFAIAIGKIKGRCEFLPLKKMVCAIFLMGVLVGCAVIENSANFYENNPAWRIDWRQIDRD